MIKNCNHKPIEGTNICSTCPKPDDWQNHAACLDFDPEAWFVPEDHTLQIHQAIKICMSCPVRAFCLESGWKDRWGVWGSYTAGQRQAIRKQFILPKDPTHRRKIIRILAYKL